MLGVIKAKKRNNRNIFTTSKSTSTWWGRTRIFNGEAASAEITIRIHSLIHHMLSNPLLLHVFIYGQWNVNQEIKFQFGHSAVQKCFIINNFLALSHTHAVRMAFISHLIIELSNKFYRYWHFFHHACSFSSCHCWWGEGGHLRVVLFYLSSHFPCGNFERNLFSIKKENKHKNSFNFRSMMMEMSEFTLWQKKLTT